MATIASRLDQLFLILFALLLPLSFSVNASLAEGGRKAEVSGNDTLVYPTFVTIDDGAVCLSGKPASYYFLPGYGDGLRNWLLFHNGGGWCKNISDCRTYIHRKGLDNDAVPIAFRDDTIFSNNSDKNPEFYNWNKVWVRYCDGSSFTGNSQKTKNGTTYYFRGARIFNAVIQELLGKGMDRAENALLLGSSAGGVATAIYCDRFRGFLPSAFRVKCFSDGGYFFLSNHHIKGNQFLSFFKGLINLHGSTDALPKSCTSKLTAALCFFPPNLKDGIYTPIFFLNSAFDLVQINYTLSIEYADCANHRNCSSRQVRVLQDL
ncbi:unnamed protein product [Cuscuta epithymum]|uniref:Pectin acetylesterase n=1 Tax=Cuscuta epithymum TaxID=186058 RepID=A0AAV0FNY6_9ASTE|nr:unnamed protein product [Cuscuta epithymum]CAH9137243.1 unnamed protein product [Cuscuta epithymum]